MALPDNSLSSVVVAGEFLSPDSLVNSVLVDWERGGIALNDGTQGLDVQDWVAYVEGDSLKVGTSQENGVEILVRPGTTWVSLAFDTNMRPALAFVQAGVAKLYWYDSAVEGSVETEFPGVLYPRLSTDDRRNPFVTSRDIIFAYVRNGALYFRQQRERFGTERLLSAVAPGILRNIGMGTGNRLLFEFRSA